MVHPEIMRLLAKEHVAVLREAGRSVPRRARVGLAPADASDVELRLCKATDDRELERLAALDGRSLPAGRVVVAILAGRIAAALPLAGGPLLADPFVHTAHLARLLELRAAQLRGPEPRRLPSRRYTGLLRGSTHA